MALADRNMVIEREYGPELAGQRVGWAAVTPYPIERFHGIHVVGATVAEDGALLQYEDREGDSRKRWWSDAAQGFLALTAVTVTVETNASPPDQKTRDYSVGFDREKKNDGRLFRRGADGHVNEEELDKTRRWFMGSAQFMPGVKQLMEAEDLGEYYPLVYYTANVMSAHPYYEYQRSSTTPPANLVMPDATMREITQAQQEVVESILQGYRDQLSEDEAMLNNLTVYSDIPASEIPDAFVASRRKVHQAEVAVTENVGKLLTYAGVYLRVGFRPTGRSWPYMDASCADEDKAFGQEHYIFKKESLKLPRES